MAAKNVPQKKEDYITNKVLAVFSVCLGGVLILMGLKKLIDFGTDSSGEPALLIRELSLKDTLRELRYIFDELFKQKR